MPGAFHPYLSPVDAVASLVERLERPSTLLVAVSGGSDSLGLLIALEQAIAARAGFGHRLVAATVDHGLRREASDEADAVASICREHSIPHVIKRWVGNKPKTGISAAAREARYALLQEACAELGADAIVTGHTFDDQVETIAMRAARKPDPRNRGLAGMAEVVLLDRSVWLLRPFLGTRRRAIREFLTEEGRGWIDDPSNEDRHYERVRVRDAVLDDPFYTPLTLRSVGLERQTLVEGAAELARDHLKVHHGVLVELGPAVLCGHADCLRHLLASLSAILGGRNHLPAAATMDRVMAMLQGHQMGRTTAGRVIFDLRRQGLFMQRETRDLPILHVAAGAQALWDGRYRVVNGSADEVVVGPMPPERELAQAMFADVPPAIAMRAMSVVPHLQVAGVAGAAIDKATVNAQPVLGPYDRFLPQFDLILASELGVLFGCEAIPAAPINVFERKS